MITEIYDHKKDFEEDLRQEWLNEKREEELWCFVSDNPDLYKEFVEDFYFDEFKKYALQALEDSR